MVTVRAMADADLPISIDMWMVMLAIVGIGRAFEIADAEINRPHPAPPGVMWAGWVRIAMIAWMMCYTSIAATHWRHVLYGALMPLGAYTAAKSLAMPLAVRRARRKWVRQFDWDAAKNGRPRPGPPAP